jgi:hypothetical protein
MRVSDMVRRRRSRVVIVVTLGAIGVLLLAFAARAAAAPDRIGPPFLRWSMSKIEQSVGQQPVAHGTHGKGLLDETFDLGPAAFSFGVSPVHGRGSLVIANNLDPDPQQFVQAEAPAFAPVVPFSVKGGVAHLDEYRSYEKHASDA